MRAGPTLTLVLAAAALMLPPQGEAFAGILDRIKKKAQEASATVRELDRDIEAIDSVDERAAAEAEANLNAAEREVEARTDVEAQAQAAVQDTEAAQAAREVQADVNHAATTDERIAAEADGRARQVEAQARVATDVEGRARREASTSTAGRAVAEAERDVAHAEQTDERLRAEATGRTRIDAVDDAERDIGQTRRALDNLADDLD